MNYKVDIDDAKTTYATVEPDPTDADYDVTRGLVGTGEARLSPGDYYVQKIGEGIAVGRALADLGTKVAERWAARSVREIEVQARRGDDWAIVALGLERLAKIFGS